MLNVPGSLHYAVPQPRNTALAPRLVRRLREALNKRPFLRNVSIMLGGAAGGQLVSVLLSPILTRLYSPDQFGILSVYLAVLTILVVVASLRYELTLPLAESDEDAMNLVAVCAIVLVVVTAAVGAGSYLIPDAWLMAFWPGGQRTVHLEVFRLLLPIGFFCLGAYYIALYLATRAGAFRQIALSRLSQGIVGPTSQIVGGLAGAGSIGLLLGSVVGQSAGTFGLLWRQLRTRTDLVRAVSWTRMRALAGRYRRFPLVASWTALLDAAGGNQLLYLLISIQYAPHIAGFIFLVERVIARPLAMVGTSVLQVFVGEAGKTASADPEKLKSRFRQVVFNQFCFASVWIVIANIAGAAFFPIVFGAEWGEAVIYLHAMSLAYLAQSVVQPVFHTLQLLEQQGIAAAWQISRLTLTVAIFAAGAYYELSAPWVIFGYSLGQALACGALLILMSISIQKRQRIKS